MRAMEIFNREPDVRNFSAGQPIFAEGEPGDVMYAVLQGEVEIRRAGRVLGTVRDGGIFGEMALLDEKPRSAAAVAKSDCRVAAIGQRRFTRLVEKTPIFALSLMQVVSDRLGSDLVT
jgi:CRP/FNR family transcriptional regulator, cyclic AMP receptor protein